MFASDFRQLCSALGFIVVLLKDNVLVENRAARAVAIARMTEDFCRTTRPELFPSHANDSNVHETDKLIETLKDNLEVKNEAQLPDDLPTLNRLYNRLLQRHRAYATDDLIADEVLHLLDEEINHAGEDNMQIAALQGDEDAFVPCGPMATAIVEILKAKGDCTPDDLKAKGFSPEEIKRHWAMAYALAKVELNWMDS